MYKGVLPSEAYFSALLILSAILTLLFNISFLLPIRIFLLFTTATTPKPTRELKSFTSKISRFLFLASSTIANPSGCSERYSTLATICKISSSV